MARLSRGRGAGRHTESENQASEGPCRRGGGRYNSGMNLRRTRACVCVCIAAFSVGLAAGVSCAADLPQVLQPNASAYTADEVALLGGALDVLRVTLSTSTYASQKTFGLGGWGKWASAEFAAYTAGILGGDGYETRLVSAAGWSDGVHTWVLVGIPLGERVAWVPVEASPELGSRQHSLGTLPEWNDSAGSLWFDEVYLSFDYSSELSENQAPTARMYVKATVEVNMWVGFSADRSRDRDGSIVLYVWDFGDGTEVISETGRYTNHRFGAAGSYVVTLTVVDNRGHMATAAAEIRASLDCGCG